MPTKQCWFCFGSGQNSRHDLTTGAVTGYPCAVCHGAKIMPDPRPSDMAGLARLTAFELRKTHGIRAMDTDKFGVFIGPHYYDVACKETWTDLGPIAIAAEIKALEALRATRDAGDK